MIPKIQTNSPDGETRTSRVVGSVDFVRPKLPINDNVDESTLLTTVTGVRCSMPYTIKCSTESFVNSDYAHVRIEQIASAVFEEVESKLSTFNPDSEVNKVNSMGMDEVHVMSDALKEVVLCSKELVKLTRGAFDPSVAPLLSHYESMAERFQSANDNTLNGNLRSANGSSRERLSSITELPDDMEKDAQVDIETIRRQRHVIDYWRSLVTAGFAGDPSDSRVSRTVRQLIDISQWHSAFSVALKGADNTENRESSGFNSEMGEYVIRKKHVDARMDLSGIAKGWAVDKIAEALPSTSCWVEWGGDIKVRGQHPSGRHWQVAVPEPPKLSDVRLRVARAKKAGQIGPVFTLADEHAKEEKEDREYLAILELRDGESVATSGDYEKVVERNGKLYCHVIHPHLGRLLELNQATLAQAVIVTKSCMVSDALATAVISQGDPSKARMMLDQFRTGYRVPVKDFLLYARQGPRIIRQTVPGLESKADREKRLSKHESATVIVVGGGLAGLSAAIEAADARATVILLEKEANTGGNSAKATSGINGWGTDTQAECGVSDEERLFERDTFRSGIGGRTDYSLVRTLSTKSSDAIHWLKSHHIPLTVLSQLGGHSAKRTHRAPAVNGNPVPIGYKIMSTLRDVINNEYEGKIEIRCGMNVTKLLHRREADGVKTVTGVEVNGSEHITADAVVLATGGFGCCQRENGLMSRFRPDLIGTPTTNGHFAQGDGVVLGEELGAELVDMDKVQLHPTGFIDPKDPSNSTKYLAPEALRGSGGILVNSYGKRFVNELDLRSVVAKGIQDNCSKYLADDGYEGPPFAYCILSEEAQELFGRAALSFYKDRLGLFDHCADMAALAALIGCQYDELVATVNDYEAAAKLGTCKFTHKDVFPSMITPESKNLVVARVTPSIHYTMGGLNINSMGEVQEKIVSIVGSHRRIRALFAAGEVTGGVHGGNRLGGNSLLECVVFGRIAGERAATVKHHQKEMFPNATSDAKERASNFVPVTLREVRNTDKKYGMNTREIRFNMHGAFQHSGMDVGQFVAIRGELDGETLMGYFSPITRPSDEGVIGILARSDERGGPIAKLLEMSRPGSTFYMCAMGGLRLKFREGRITYHGNELKRIGLLAGGTGIAPMIQIIRAYGHFVKSHPHPEQLPKFQLNLVYACEEMNDLAYMQILDTVKQHFPNNFRYYVKLNRPPLGWTEGVGFVERSDIIKHLFDPSEKTSLVVMCGPPVFEAAMRKTLVKLGFDRSQYYSYAEGDNVAAHL